MTSSHKFKVGRRVSINRDAAGAPSDVGSFEVAHLLPAENGTFQYRIRSADGRVQRIVLESQLR